MSDLVGTRVLTPSRKVGVVLAQANDMIRVRITCRVPTTRADAGEPLIIEAVYATEDILPLPRPPQRAE